jgi:hypothetical protein
MVAAHARVCRTTKFENGASMSVMGPTIRTAIAALAVLPILALGQTKPDRPIPTTVCELVKSPASFNGKIITLREPIQIAFENFGLAASDCIEKKIDYLWLEYGRGPKRQPTTWCCGDMVPRDRLALMQNAEFHRFHHYITTVKKAKACYDCYLYRVTATLTGKFDAVEPRAGTLCGFGHLGAACGRLVIAAVSDVVADPVDPSAYERK